MGGWGGGGRRGGDLHGVLVEGVAGGHVDGGAGDDGEGGVVPRAQDPAPHQQARVHGRTCGGRRGCGARAFGREWECLQGLVWGRKARRWMWARAASYWKQNRDVGGRNPVRFRWGSKRTAGDLETKREYVRKVTMRRERSSLAGMGAAV